MEDSKCASDGGLNAALKMALKPEVVAILGPTCSSTAIPASRILSEPGKTLISGSVSSPALTLVSGGKGVHWYPGFFRTVPSDAERGRVAALYCYNDLGKKRVAVINDGDSFTRQLTKAFKNSFEKLGGRVVADITVNKGETEMGQRWKP